MCIFLSRETFHTCGGCLSVQTDTNSFKKSDKFCLNLNVLIIRVGGKHVVLLSRQQFGQSSKLQKLVAVHGKTHIEVSVLEGNFQPGE